MEDLHCTPGSPLIPVWHEHQREGQGVEISEYRREKDNLGQVSRTWRDSEKYTLQKMKGVESRRSGHRTLTKLRKDSAAAAYHVSDPPQLRPPRIGRTWTNVVGHKHVWHKPGLLRNTWWGFIFTDIWKLVVSYIKTLFLFVDSWGWWALIFHKYLVKIWFFSIVAVL